jgi:hypothetical protein
VVVRVNVAVVVHRYGFGFRLCGGLLVEVVVNSAVVAVVEVVVVAVVVGVVAVDAAVAVVVIVVCCVSLRFLSFSSS